MEQGREVFALPWSILHDGGRGCLKLIRDGAKMVQDANDILEELGPVYALQQASYVALSLGKRHATPSRSWLLTLVGFEAVAVDELVKRSARPVGQVLAELSALELAGQVVRTAGGFIRC